jgi:DNA-binding CsgD family transcriptional regulator
MLEQLREAREADSPRAAEALVDVLFDLTPRELDVLNALLEGWSGKQAARALGISPNTFDSHRTRIFLKFRVHSANELLVRFAKARFAFAALLDRNPHLSALPEWLTRRSLD